MITQLDTENADRDLTSTITVLTDTPDASNAMICQGLVMLGDGAKDLDGTGGTFELVITVDGQTVQPSPQEVEFGTEVRSSVWTTPFPVPANKEVIMRVKSPNAADTDVDVTAYLYDVSAQPAIVANNLDHLAAVATGAADMTTEVVDNSILSRMLANGDTSAFVPSTDGLQLIRDVAPHGSAMVGTDSANTTTPPTVDAIADQVWDEVLTGATHNVATSAGRRLRQVAGANIIYEGTAAGAGGGNNTIELAADASAVNDFYKYAWIIIVDATGVGQIRHVESYVGATKIATFDRDWLTNPDATSDIILMAQTRVHVHEIDEDGLAQINAEADQALSDYGANTTVPDAAGTAAGLHGTTDGLIGGLVVPDAAGTAAGLIGGLNNISTAQVNTEVDTALSDINLDHLCKTATAAADMTAEVADDTILSRILSNGDTSAFVPSTDGLQLIRDVAPHGSAMVGTNGANTTVPDAAGTAAGLHGTTDGLIGGLVVPDAAGTAATLHGITDGKVDVVDANVDAILADTGTAGVVVAAASKTGYALTAAYDAAKTAAQAGDAMTLAADAIKSTSYDESTAYPLKSADTGATQVARVGADGDTLEDLSDQLDGLVPGAATNLVIGGQEVNIT